ncbi:MAG: hypothetical protein CMJ89_15820 [Planctomycetes bacterium]|nr:hypothetical protein [Planctomycetota bacterium]
MLGLLFGGFFAIASSVVALQEGNRLWWVELEVEGPARALRIEAGEDGVTKLEGGVERGEAFRRTVPVPFSSPLGASGLSVGVLPRVVWSGEGEARLLGWSADQPAAILTRTHRALLARPRPVPGPARPRASTGALLALLALTGLSAGLRKRPLAAGVVCGVGALVLWGASARPPDAPETVRVLEAGMGPRALEVTAARNVLALPTQTDRLEVDPPGVVLSIALDPHRAGSVRVRAEGALLRALRAADPPVLTPTKNDWQDMAQVWTRSGEGAWRHHDAWPRGEALPSASDETEQDPSPPGWLASGLAPGRGVLLGRCDAPRGSLWLRLSGWGE